IRKADREGLSFSRRQIDSREQRATETGRYLYRVYNQVARKEGMTAWKDLMRDALGYVPETRPAPAIDPDLEPIVWNRSEVVRTIQAAHQRGLSLRPKDF